VTGSAAKVSTAEAGSITTVTQQGGLTMLINRGGQKASPGTYWNLADGRRIDLAAEGVLPENSKSVFIKMPTVGILFAGPLLGLLYAVFLPFIGIAMTLILIGTKLVNGVAHVAAKSTSFGWNPVEAYLEGRRKKSKQPGEPKGRKK
jgi:hypothetical protein